MWENRTCGSEGGEALAIPTPIYWGEAQCDMASVPPAIPVGPTIPRHVIPAQAGLHTDVANHGPARGGLVGRRDRHGDDVGGVGASGKSGTVEDPMASDWVHGPPRMPSRPASRDPRAGCGAARLFDRIALRSPGRRIRSGEALWLEWRCETASTPLSIPGCGHPPVRHSRAGGKPPRRGQSRSRKRRPGGSPRQARR